MPTLSLLLEFDPRVPSGRAGLGERALNFPAVLSNWERRLQEAFAAAERLGVDSTAARELERARSEYADLSLLGSSGSSLPQHYQRGEQLALLEFVRQLLAALEQSSDSRADDELAAYLRSVRRLVAYALEHRLLVRIGRPEEQEAEARELLVLANRQNQPLDATELSGVTVGALEVPGVQILVDELLVFADGLGLDTRAIGESEYATRQQPSPGRVRDDEDIAELLAFIAALDARAKRGQEQWPPSLQSRAAQLEALLRFASTEQLLLSTRRARVTTQPSGAGGFPE